MLADLSLNRALLAVRNYTRAYLARAVFAAFKNSHDGGLNLRRSQGAGHLAWTNFNRKFQEPIDTYSVAFFDRYLKGNASPDSLGPLLRKPLPKGVSDLRTAE